jgi:hypothetical protein
VNIELNIPPKVQSIIASIEYPLIKIKGRYFSIIKMRIGEVMPIKREAKGSIITTAEELKNIPVYIIKDIQEEEFE